MSNFDEKTIDYYKNIDFSILNKTFNLYFDNLKKSKEEKERCLWALKLYSEYLQTIETFFLNIFAITDNNLWENLFLSNSALRNKIEERFYKDKDRKFFDDNFLNYFLDNWVFVIKEKDRIKNLDSKKSLYKMMIREIVKDYLSDYELLNSFKHGLRIRSAGNNSIAIGAKKSSKVFKLGEYNTKIFYLKKIRNEIYESTLSFNWERIAQKYMFLINILENMQKLLLNNGGEVKLETLYISDKKEYSKYFGTFRWNNFIEKIVKKMRNNNQQPKNWKETKLGKVANVKNGKSNAEDATINGEYIFFDRSKNAKRSDKFLFDCEAIIIAGEGKEFIPRIYSGKFDLHQRAYAIYNFSKDIFPKFAFYYLAKHKKYFEKIAVGSTVKSLRMNHFTDFPISFPSFSEQKKIAEILSKVDKDIEKTERVIEGIERMKKGLMRELLTKGIGHKKFKKTELGEIPEKWEVVKMKDSEIKLIDGDRGVNYPKLQDFSDNDHCLFLNNKNIKNDRFVFNESSFISKEKDEKLRKGKLKREDIILTSRGTVGNVAYYNLQIPFENIRINSGMLILRHGKNYDPLFLYKLLSGPFIKQRYKDMGTGSAQPQLPIKSLEQIKIPLLPIKEQKQIAEILSEVDNKIDINKLIKNKLTQLKKGLMEDLLSGRVRVK